MKRLLLIVLAVMSLQSEIVLAKGKLPLDQAMIEEAQLAVGIGQKRLLSEYTGKSLGPNKRTDVKCIDEVASALGVRKADIHSDITTKDGI